MTNEALGTSDGASIVLPSHHTVRALATAQAALARPVDVFGHSVEELLDLAHTRHHGEPVLHPHSLEMALTPIHNAIRLRVHDSAGKLKQLIFDANCRTNNGGIWLAELMGGDVNANLGYVNSAGAGAFTATTVTPTASPVWTVNQWVGHIVVAPTTVGATPSFVYGNVISNTATALTIDQWYLIASATGAAGSTPPANASFVILPGQGPSFWIALSTDATLEDIGNTTLTSELTSGFTTTGRWKGVYSLTTTPAGTGTTNSNAVYKIDTGVLTANATNTITKLGLFHTQNGGNLDFVKKLTVAASVQSADTLDGSWAVTLS